MASSGIRRSPASLSRPSRTRRLDVEPVVHQLEEVVVAAEDVLEVAGRLAGGVVVAVAQVDLDLARGAAGRADDAAAVLGEQLAVHARVLEEPVAPGAGGEPEQVVHALGRLREQRHVGVGAAGRDVVGAAAVEVDALLLEAGDVRGEVGLDADDRLDPGVLRLAVELVGAEHVAVVGHRDRGHAQLGGPRGERSQPGGTVEHGVLGVHVEVDEGVSGRSAIGGRATPLGGRTDVLRRRPGAARGRVAHGRRRSCWGKDVKPTAAVGPMVTGRTDKPCGEPVRPRSAGVASTASRLSVMIACTIRATRSSPSSGARAPDGRDRALPGRVPARVGLVRLHGPGQRGPTGQQVAELVVDVVDEPPEERERLGSGPGHPDVGRPLLVGGAVGPLELDQPVPLRRTGARRRWTRTPRGRSRRAAPTSRRRAGPSRSPGRWRRARRTGRRASRR